MTIAFQIDKKNYFDEEQSLICIIRERIVQALRKVGCVRYSNDQPTNSYFDVPFVIKRTQIKTKFIVVILSEEMPTDYSYYDLLMREKILQSELCLPIHISKVGDFIKIDIFLSYYHLLK